MDGFCENVCIKNNKIAETDTVLCFFFLLVFLSHGIVWLEDGKQ